MRLINTNTGEIMVAAEGQGNKRMGGGYFKDANGVVLDRVVQKVGVVEVTQVLSQSSIAKVVEGEAAVNDTVK